MLYCNERVRCVSINTSSATDRYNYIHLIFISNNPCYLCFMLRSVRCNKYTRLGTVLLVQAADVNSTLRTCAAGTISNDTSRLMAHVVRAHYKYHQIWLLLPQTYPLMPSLKYSLEIILTDFYTFAK